MHKVNHEVRTAYYSFKRQHATNISKLLYDQIINMKHIRNTFKFLKCGARVRRGGLVGPIVLKMKKYYKKPRRKRNILATLKRSKANSIGHMLRWNCLLQRVIEGMREVTERRGR